jgi:hypothetical protein
MRIVTVVGGVIAALMTLLVTALASLGLLHVVFEGVFTPRQNSQVEQVSPPDREAGVELRAE